MYSLGTGDDKDDGNVEEGASNDLTSKQRSACELAPSKNCRRMRVNTKCNGYKGR